MYLSEPLERTGAMSDKNSIDIFISYFLLKIGQTSFRRYVRVRTDTLVQKVF